MLKLLDTGKEFVRHISGYTDLKIDSELKNGDMTLSFSLPGDASDIENEFYIETKTNRFVVKEIEPGDDQTSFVCKLDLEALEADMLAQYTAENKTCSQAAAIALTGTGWLAIVDSSISLKVRSVQQFKKTPLDCLYKIRDAFMCDIWFDTINEYVYFGTRGKDKGVYFRPELNLVSLSPTFDSYDYYTRIIPIGKDGLDITSLTPGGVNYVENYQYSSKIKALIWEDTSYESAQALYDDAVAKLGDLSKPKRSYSAQVRDLAKLSTQYSILSYGLGDTVHITDAGKRIMDDQRIVKMTEYPDDPEKNTAEISNTVLSWEEMQAALKAAADAWDDISNPDGSVNGVYVHGVQVGDVVGIGVFVNGEIDTNSTVAGKMAKNMSNVDISNIDTQQVNALYANTGLIKKVVIEQGHVVDFLDAVEVNCANITAGTLVADRIVIRGTNQSVVYAMNTITGAVQAANVDTLNGEILTDRTINADKIIAHSITANEIAAHTITASEITTSNIVGSNGWINLANGTFAYGTDKLTWNGTTLSVKGSITSSDGSIGGFTIGSNTLSRGNYISLESYNSTYSKARLVMGNTSAAHAILTDGGLNMYDSSSNNTYIYPTQAFFAGTLSVYGATTLGTLSSTAITENGTALVNKYAAKSHTHSYLPLSGGTLTGDLTGTSIIAKTTGTGTSAAFQAVTTGGSKNIGMYVSNGSQAGMFYVSSGNNLGIYNSTASGWMIYSSSGGGVTIPQTLSVGSTLTVSGAVYANALDNSDSRPAILTGASGYRISRMWGQSTTQCRLAAQAGNTTTYATYNISMASSDIRLKENVEDTGVKALDVLDMIRIRQFDWKGGGHQDIGFIADELEALDPKLATGGGYDEDGHMIVKAVDTFYLLGYLTKAVQELSARIKQLENAA